MKIKKILIWATVTIVLIAAAVAAPFGYAYYCVKIQKVKLSETVYIHITPEDNAESVMSKIEQATGVASTKGFRILAEHNNFDSRTRSGRFAINNGDDMHSIYRRIVSKEQTPVRITVPPTREITQIASTLGKSLMTDSAAIMHLLDNELYLDCMGFTMESRASMFIPDTYEVYWNITAEDLIVRLLEERRKFWNNDRKAKAAEIGMSPEDVAILASIVDEETNNIEEMPTVAGLYINRLNKGMMLQADPTVKFALNDPTRKRILESDLEIDSPYNTYKHTGLPPGPIRIPTKQALESVLNYARHDFLFMCAKEDFSGTHNFAKTLREHNANARRYQQALDQLDIKK